MSFYNAMHGMNSGLLIIASTVLGYRLDEKFPRFRDVFLKADDSPFEADLYVYTRMGGGNRECSSGRFSWSEDYRDENGNCTCDACICRKFDKEPWCAGSYDDDWDRTYRTFGIKLTESQKEELDSILKGEVTEDFERRAKLMFNTKKQEE